MMNIKKANLTINHSELAAKGLRVDAAAASAREE